MYYNQIKNLRKQMEMTMQELADKSGVSVGYICHLENGSRRNPSIEVMRRIATVLDRTVSEVFFDQDL